MPTTNGSRVLLIGLDSLDIDYALSHIGSLPNLQRVFAGGVVRRLDSPGNVMSASVWPTFYTGTLPGEHGQYFPMQWDPTTMRLRHVASDWIDCEPFWRPLARQGLPVTTLDVQAAFPSRTTAGTEIVNWGVEAFGGFHCNQPELGREIARRFGTNVLGPDVPVDKSPRRLTEIRKAVDGAASRRGELARWLLTNTTWKLFIAVFPECHRAGHYFWRDPTEEASEASDDALLDAHRTIDREVGALLEAVDLRDTSVIVFSLLGMGPNQSQMHLVPPVIDRINAAFASRDGASAPARRARRIVRLLRERLPARLQELVALSVPEPVRDWVTGRAYAGAVDWRRTPAFPLPTGGEGYIRLNIQGRETPGCLERGSALHQRYLETLREGFLSLRDAETGEPLVETVNAPPLRFPGPRSDYLPDLAIAWRPGAPATAVHSDRLGSFTGRLKTGRGGNHRSAAFAAVAGPARDSRRPASLETIIDLTNLVRDLALGRA
ncbi:MAG TPA: alkaline phosphatase family protein [Thermoanaerobaculia bacterium]